MTKLNMQLQCPLPKMDFDYITLGHGSGGLLTHQLLETGVFNLLKNDLLDTQHDGAVFTLSGRTAFTTDSFVISPIFFPGGNIGSLAVHGTVNDLAMCGAIPKYLSLSFIIEEGLTMVEFWEILLSIKAACQEAGVQVVTGDTKVVEKGKGDKIFINTTGIGTVHPQAQIGSQNIKVGDKIIISNQIAAHGIAIMSLREGLRFESEIESDSRALNHIVKMLLDNFGDKIHLLRDATRGGVATVLNEIAQFTNLGMEISQAKLPLADQVAGVCEILGLDPLYVANEGVFVAFVAAEVAEDCLQLLQAQAGSQAASIVGEVVEEHPRKVILKSGIGGKRVVSLLPGEQLPRIC